MNRYAALAALVVAAALGAGAAWTWQELTITQIESRHKDERIAIQRAARAVAEKRVAAQRLAETHAVAATQRAVVERGQLAAVGSGLRLATASAERTADGDLAACTQQVRTLRVISDECSTEYESMAGHAQDWFVEAVKQHEAAQ